VSIIMNQSLFRVVTPYKESYNPSQLDVVQPLLTTRQDNFHSTYDLTILMLT
jgi:hypothetical protein